MREFCPVAERDGFSGYSLAVRTAYSVQNSLWRRLWLGGGAFLWIFPRLAILDLLELLRLR